MELNAKHLRIIDLLVDSRFATGDDEGMTQKQIAEEVGVRQEQISRWKQDPDFSAILEDRTYEYRRGIEQVSDMPHGSSAIRCAPTVLLITFVQFD